MSIFLVKLSFWYRSIQNDVFYLPDSSISLEEVSISLKTAVLFLFYLQSAYDYLVLCPFDIEYDKLGLYDNA